MKVTLVGLAALVATLAVGCGGKDESSSSSATAWANSVCGAVVTWRDTLDSTVKSLQGGNVTREALTDSAKEMQDATKKLADDLGSLETPDLPSKQKAQKSVDDLRQGLNADVEKMQKAAEDATGAAGALNAISVISATLATMGQSMTATVDELKSLDTKGELHDAFANADSCDKLKS
jgi:hypothetical protein